MQGLQAEEDERDIASHARVERATKRVDKRVDVLK